MNTAAINALSNLTKEKTDMGHTITDVDVMHFVSGALTDDVLEEFDIDAIVRELIFQYDITGYHDLSGTTAVDRVAEWLGTQIPEGEFWDVVAKHDRSVSEITL